MIYADNAATTQLDPEAFEAMKPFLLENYGNASQPYAFGQRSKKAVEEARRTIASCIGALPEEIIFTSGGTESDNWVIKNAPKGIIVTSQIEHHAILNSCKRESEKGREVIYLPVDKNAVVDKSFLRNVDSKKIALVSIMMANNEVGTIQGVKDFANIAHSMHALFHTDAVQAVGHIPIDVKNQEIDLLSASAHKFNGPKGIGFLFRRKGLQLEEYISGGNQEGGSRSGTENVAEIVGMSVALEKNVRRMQANETYIRGLEEILIDELEVAKIQFRRNGINGIPGNISLSFPGMEGETILHRLDIAGICVSTGSACDSKNVEISHVLRGMQIPDKYALGTIRISLGVNNTKEEIYEIAKQLVNIVRR